MAEDREAWLRRRSDEVAAEKAAKAAKWAEDQAARLEVRRSERASERESRRTAWDHDPDNANVRHEIEMAEKLGISVEEFRLIQERRREEMKGKPKISYSPDHVVR